MRQWGCVLTDKPIEKPKNRIEAIDVKKTTALLYLDKKPELSPKHRLMADYMVNGCPHSYIGRLTDAHGNPLKPNEPLTLNQAADVLRIRRRSARALVNHPAFRSEHAKRMSELRNGEAAMSLHRIIQIRDDGGEGKAADRKVQLTAAQALLGEGGSAGGSRVSVNVTNVVQPGYVISLPKDKTIEGEVIDQVEEEGDADGMD